MNLYQPKWYYGSKTVNILLTIMKLTKKRLIEQNNSQTKQWALRGMRLVNAHDLQWKTGKKQRLANLNMAAKYPQPLNVRMAAQFVVRPREGLCDG